MRGTPSFEVYLTEEASAGVGEPPVEAEEVDFYESGVWVAHPHGRDFFPYERVLRIRELSDESASGERRDAASGTTRSVDEADLDVS